MMPKMPGPISAGCAKFATPSQEESFRASAWKYYPWACRTTLKWQSKRARPAYGWEQPSSESARSHDDFRVAAVPRTTQSHRALREMIPISETDAGVTFA